MMLKLLIAISVRCQRRYFENADKGKSQLQVPVVYTDEITRGKITMEKKINEFDYIPCERM